MKLLKNGKSWVAVKNNIDKSTLKNLILKSDICISDLDGTDGEPGKIVLLSELKSQNIINPKFVCWALKNGLRLLKEGKNAESEVWKSYVQNYLRGKNEIKKKKKLLKNIEKVIYPGVEEFYKLLDCYKIYLTRNTIEISSLFAYYFKFNQVIAQTYDKEKAVCRLVEKGMFKRFILKGDTVEDEASFDALKFYEKKGKIEYVIGIYITKKKRLNEKFEVNIGKNYEGLVSILKEN